MRLKIVRVHRVNGGSCGHALVKTLLAETGEKSDDGILRREIPQDAKRNTSSDDIVKFLGGRGFDVTEKSVADLPEIERSLNDGWVGLTTVRVRPEPALLHWTLVTWINREKNGVETACCLYGVRGQKLREFLGRVKGSIWMVRKP